MRCARCRRVLLLPGVPVELGGGRVIAGPRCAELLIYGELGRSRRRRVIPLLRRRRADGQADLFEMAADLSGSGSR